ncbi:uncharacterized protein LOC126886640 [Diabrotica virgifera virgifera]|uniref:E3 ubiquitin-protein ligase SINAT5-like n=1 Tax=Diabrotica virgifera virgifera TaxID=50390 RepID=A0A6P7FCC2_DIAVI|nr:uncharacterized protein LOC126886640 [Diabrotica virgifera virgifera]
MCSAASSSSEEEDSSWLDLDPLFEALHSLDDKVLDESTERAITRQLQCPICRYIMRPPILTCALNHSFCFECYKLIYRCSLCTSEKVDRRNLQLEAQYYKVSLSCKYKENGCDFKARHRDLGKHEKECTHTIKGCPFNYTSLCSWGGTVYKLLDHCADMHHYSYSTQPVTKLCYVNFDLRHHHTRMHMIFAHDCYFRVTLAVDETRRWLRLACYYLGHQNKKIKYIYEVKFLRRNTEHKIICLSQNCQFLANHDLAFGPGSPMIFPVSVLLRLCDENGDLHYVVSITAEKEGNPNMMPSTSK